MENAQFAEERKEKDEKNNGISEELLMEWNYEKNEGMNPEDYTADSSEIVWWKCLYGHEWKAPIKSRSEGRGCPYDSVAHKE